MIIRTDRLTIRPLIDDDLEDLIYLDSDPAVMKYITGGEVPTREDYQRTYLPRQRQYSQHDRGWGLWHCSLTQSGEFIGWILSRPMGFFSDDERDDSDIELGWRFVQSSWGKGYASEAAVAVVEYLSGFDEVTRISAIAEDENLASVGVMKKLGMSFVKKAVHRDPLFEAEVVYYSREL